MTALLVLEPGPATVVQDLGRPGLESWGVAPSGAFDRAAHARAQRLVGNPPGAAGLEVLVGGLAVVTEGDLVVAVTGAACPVDVDGRPEGRDVALVVRSGAVLRVGSARSGLRAYVAVRGGLATETVLGSRSRDAGGRLGPPPFTAGCVLPVGEDVAGEPAYTPVVAPASERDELVIVPGPHGDLLDPEATAWFRSTGWEVRPESDRMGVRLSPVDDAPRAWLRRVPAGLPSFPVVPGSVQALPSGEVVVLGPDAGVTGGYAVIGVVDRAGLDALAQSVPGQRLRFRWTRSTAKRRSPGRDRGSKGEIRQYQ